MVEWTWCHCWVPLQGAVGVVASQGAMVGGVTANFGAVDVVPLQGAIVVCYGWGGGDDQLWRSGRGAIDGCRCSVLWWGGGVTTNFGGVDVVPLITQELVFAIWGLCWYNFSVVQENLLLGYDTIGKMYCCIYIYVYLHIFIHIHMSIQHIPICMSAYEKFIFCSLLVTEFIQLSKWMNIFIRVSQRRSLYLVQTNSQNV